MVTNSYYHPEGGDITMFGLKPDELHVAFFLIGVTMISIIGSIVTSKKKYKRKTYSDT